MAANQPQYASASLYVGDLAPDVTEALLYETFNAVGPVASIRVCRDAATRESLGYAYVNYHNLADAERALDTLNFALIKKQPCRIMWSHRDPSLRKSGAGNVFVKNLDKSIDNRSLYDTFSLFGNILSCKVQYDEYGKSKGYGFVHYESEESAKAAIEKVNGMAIGSKTVYVGPFKKRSERSGNTKFTNLYVKNFPKEWTQEVLEKVFQKFGAVTSSALMTDSKGRPFGFVNFADPIAAKAAVDELHGKVAVPDGVSEKPATDEGRRLAEASGKKPEKAEKKPDGQPKVEEEASEAAEKKPDEEDEGKVYLYVQRAQSKAERMQMLKDQFTRENKPRRQGLNLFVKNLHESIDNDELRKMFSKFGTITSAKVMTDSSGISKGHGFVNFAVKSDGEKAVSWMHLRVIKDKPLYVSIFEEKEQRRGRLQKRYHMLPAGMMNAVMPPAAHPIGGMPQGMPFSDNAPMMYGGMGPQQGAEMGNRMGPTLSGYPHQPSGMGWRPQNARYGPSMVGYPQADMWRGQNPRQFGGPQTVMASAAPMMQHQSIKFTPQARNRVDMQGPGPQGQSVLMPGQQPPMASVAGPQMPNMQIRKPNQPEQFSLAELANAPPEVAKQMVGERLFPLVARHQPQLAAKITGMMIEMDTSELLVLLQSEQQLKAKIDEALTVLQRHQSQGSMGS